MTPIPSDAVYDLARPMSVAVSPDGDRVAVHVLGCDRGADRQPSSVLVVPADESREPHDTRRSDPIVMRWSPDG